MKDSLLICNDVLKTISCRQDEATKSLRDSRFRGNDKPCTIPIMRKLSILLVILILMPLNLGWANGPKKGNGFGTHDWILKEAWDALGRPSWFKYEVARRASDDPDTVLRDGKNHTFDIWGDARTGSPKKIAELFNRAVGELRVGNQRAAGRSIGLMSHYFADINSPLHTDNLAAEKRMFDSYENAVETRTDEPDEATFTVSFDGKNYIKNVRRFSRKSAILAHADYKTLVAEYNLAGFDATVTAITRRNLNRAVNRLADLIYSVKRRARVPQRAVIETDKGTMVIELYPEVAPVTVANFKKLISKGFYNGLTFHRVVPGFVIQGGDPTGYGTGGPGYTIPAEFNSKTHLRGTVAMARASDPDSGGSQFYICLAPQPSLDGQYTVFGQVVEGLDVIDKIEVDDVMRRVYLR